jgi:hypothetical protein
VCKVVGFTDLSKLAIKPECVLKMTYSINIEILIHCNNLPSIERFLRIYCITSPLSPLLYWYSNVHIDRYSARSLVCTSMKNSTSVLYWAYISRRRIPGSTRGSPPFYITNVGGGVNSGLNPGFGVLRCGHCTVYLTVIFTTIVSWRVIGWIDTEFDNT